MIHLRTILLLLVFTLTTSNFLKAEKTPPNIIFILSDDQGYGDIGRHGHPLLDTPNLDKLWDESVRFDNFYVSPSCSPTRAALLTGKHEFLSGVTHTLKPREHLSLKSTTLPQLLQDAGYATGFIGKWHLGGGKGYGPSYRGFQWCSSNTKGPREHFNTTIVRNGKYFPTKGYREDRFFDEAELFIKEHKKQPFFLYLATYSPHAPYDAPSDLVTKYKAMGVTDSQAKYLGMVENIDQNVGRLRAFLISENLAKNTLLVYMNDNGITEGLEVYNANMRGSKCSIWEGGSRAMSLWHWADNWKPRTVKKELTAHLDVLPTLLDIATITPPEDLAPKLQGKSLLPLLKGISSSWHQDRILFHSVARWTSGFAEAHKGVNTAVRKGDYLLLKSSKCTEKSCLKKNSICLILDKIEKGAKASHYTAENAQYHWGISDKNWSLYNVKTDPGNLTNLASKHPELVSQLSEAYSIWWDETYPEMIANGGDKAEK